MESDEQEAYTSQSESRLDLDYRTAWVQSPRGAQYFSEEVEEGPSGEYNRPSLPIPRSVAVDQGLVTKGWLQNTNPIQQQRMLSPERMTGIPEHILRAHKALGAELIPTASVTAEFRDKLLSLINLDFHDYLTRTSGVIADAQKMFEYKGMDIWIIL